MSCPSCGRDSGPGARFCGFCGKRLDAPARGTETRIRVATTPEVATVSPGGGGQVTVALVNAGSIVEHVRVEVEGPAAAWTAIEGARTRLMPGETRQAVVRLSPPASSDGPAGRHPLVVVARRDDAGGTTLGEATGWVEVGPLRQVTLRVVPRRKAAWRSTRRLAELGNAGNAPLTVTLRGTDPDDALDFAVPSSPLELPVGVGNVSRRFDVRAKRLNLWGKPIEREMSLHARWEGGAEVAASAVLVQRALMTFWRLVFILAVLALWAIAVVSARGGL